MNERDHGLELNSFRNYLFPEGILQRVPSNYVEAIVGGHNCLVTDISLLSLRQALCFSFSLALSLSLSLPPLSVFLSVARTV